ncbi:ead/Ea22-like family protein [Salmonella enterica subsp. enterica serovar Minnesota]|nr:ead/Ea22-like family protein [Salmonella enterica subsp. enterica serovar Minnesota]EDQ6894313.1 ead/Ea22-like family protein [Salmonella enterica subsp. enterica serovar Minnesota]
MSNIDKQALRERYSPKPVPECHICGEEMTIQRISASRITYGCTGATYDDKGCHYAEGRSIADDHYEQSRVTVVDVSDPDVLALLDEVESKQTFQHAFFRQSLMYDVVAEAYEEAKEQIAKDVEIKARLCRESNSLHDRLRAAERSIAELESKNSNLRTIAHERNELAIRANLDSINDAVEMDRLHKRIAELEAREVMLPAEKFCPSEYAGSQHWEETEVWNKAISACAVAIRAAGIKVKES